MLVLHRVDVASPDRFLLRHVSLRVAVPGLLCLVGGGGAGKSSLLKALAGADADLRLTGSAFFKGAALPLAPPAVFVAQNAMLDDGASALDSLRRLHGIAPAQALAWLAEADFGDHLDAAAAPAGALPAAARRFLAVRAALQREAPLYLVDEPTAGLPPAAVETLRARLRDLAQTACVVLVTHDRRDCLALGGRTALLAGGGMQECTDTEVFFRAPTTAAGRTYVDTGNCSLPHGHAGTGVAKGIWWLTPGLLCGMSRPGLAAEAQEQFRLLREGGVRVLVCAEERCAYAPEAARAVGLQFHHMAMADMAPPTFAQAVDVCRVAEPAIAANEGLAVHCRGGMGRTGTLLAAVLIWFGDSAADAVRRVRAARPGAIQSAAQGRFLLDFAQRIQAWR